MKVVARWFVLLPLLWVAALASLNADAATEIEPNNTSSQANALALGETMVGNLPTTSDVDWYRVYHDSEGTLTLTFESSIFADVNVFNPAGELVARNPNVSGSQQTPIGVTESDYHWIAVYQDYQYTGQYSLSVQFNSEEVSAEVERNNTATQANELTNSQTLKGHLYNAADEDWYKIEHGTSGTLQFTFANYTFYDLQVYNAAGVVVATDQNVSGSQTISVGFNYSGYHYVRIYDGYGSNNGSSYELTATISGPPPAAPSLSLLSTTDSSATFAISENDTGAAPEIDSFTVTCEEDGPAESSSASRENHLPRKFSLGQLTAETSYRSDAQGTSLPHGRIYRPNPALSSARVSDTLIFTAPYGDPVELGITDVSATTYGNRLIKAKNGPSELIAVITPDGDFASSLSTDGDQFVSQIFEGKTVLYTRSAGEIAATPFADDMSFPQSSVNDTAAPQSFGTPPNSPTVISVGVQYDNATRDAYDEIAQAELAIAYANEAYQNSDVDIVFQIAGIRNHNPYTSTGAMELTLNEISCGSIACEVTNNSPHNLNVKAWRDEIGADLIVQLVRYGTIFGTCGMAWVPPSASWFSNDLDKVTYSVNALELPNGTACGSQVVAHEMGHNLGLGHDISTDPDFRGYYSYARGYKNSTFGTVMSYTNNHAPYLSNPNKTYLGLPVGVAIGESDEAHAAQAVSNVMHLHEALYENSRVWRTTVTSSPAVISGLPASTRFSCEATATSVIGDSSSSNTLVITTTDPPTAPAVPTITSTDYEDGTIILTVSVSDNGGTDITGYEATCTDGTNTFTGTSTSSPITVSGLTNDVAYTCTVTATNSVGTSSASAATDPITPEETSTGLPIWLLYQATQ